MSPRRIRTGQYPLALAAGIEPTGNVLNRHAQLPTVALRDGPGLTSTFRAGESVYQAAKPLLSRPPYPLDHDKESILFGVVLWFKPNIVGVQGFEP